MRHLVPLVLVTLAAGAAVAEPLPGSAWLAVQAGSMPLQAADEVTLDFAEGRVSGRSGCNRYAGAAELVALTPASGRIVLGPVVGTRMACIGHGDRVEQAVLTALGAVDGWRIEGDGTLVLTGGSEDLIRARPR